MVDPISFTTTTGFDGDQPPTDKFPASELDSLSDLIEAAVKDAYLAGGNEALGWVTTIDKWGPDAKVWLNGDDDISLTVRWVDGWLEMNVSLLEAIKRDMDVCDPSDFPVLAQRFRLLADHIDRLVK